MDKIVVIGVLLMYIISMVVIFKNTISRHYDWENSWSRVAKSAGVRYTSGDFVHPCNFKGTYRGYEMELKVTQKGLVDLVPMNIYTSIMFIMSNTIQGRVSITSKQQSPKANITNSEDLFDYMYIAKSDPDNLVNLLLPPMQKKQLQEIPMEQFILDENRLYLLIEGVETREDVLIDCISLLYKIAQNIEARCPVSG